MHLPLAYAVKQRPAHMPPAQQLAVGLMRPADAQTLSKVLSSAIERVPVQRCQCRITHHTLLCHPEQAPAVSVPSCMTHFRIPHSLSRSRAEPPSLVGQDTVLGHPE